MRIVIVILLLFCLGRVEAQSHAEEYYEFDCAYKTMLGYYNRGLYHKAVLYPDSLEGNRHVTPSINYFCARVYALSNDFEKTLEYLEKAVKGGITSGQIDKMYDLDRFRESNFHIIYEMNCDKWRQEYLDLNVSSSLDSNYIGELFEIRKAYEKMWERVGYNEVGEIVMIKDSIEFNRQKDSLNNYVLDLIMQKGIPLRRNVGREFFFFSRRLGNNLPEEFDLKSNKWMMIKELIFDEMAKGNLKPFYYAVIEDNIRLSRKLPQIYATMPVVFNGNDDVSDVLQYENPEELNIRRRSVGLCPIQLELWSRARELPKSLKEVEFK